MLTVKDIVLRMHSNHFHVLCNSLCTFCFTLLGISEMLYCCLPACLMLYTIHSTVPTRMYNAVILIVSYPR